MKFVPYGAKSAIAVGWFGLGVWALPGFAQEWPCFTGPNHDNVATSKDLANEWPKEGPKVTWDAKVSGGTTKEGGCFASPVVAGGKVFVIGRNYESEAKYTVKPSSDFLHCLDARDGKELWKQEFSLHAPFDKKTCWNTPVADGDFLYARGGDGELRCIHAGDGKTVWSWPQDMAELEKMIAGKKPIRDSAISAPCIVIDDILIFPVYGGGKARILGLDKKTGAQKWEIPEYGCWQFSAGCMIPMKIADKTIVIVKNFAFDPKTGKNVMALAKDKNNKDVPGSLPSGIDWMAAVQGNKLVTVYNRTRQVPKEQEAAEEQKHGKNWKSEAGIVCMEVSMDAQGAVSGKTLWEACPMIPPPNPPKSYGGPVILGSHAYVFLGREGKDLACLSMADGKVAWRQEKMPHGMGFASCVGADGKIFFQLDGQLTMVAADPAAFKELGSVRTCGAGFSTPAIFGTQMIVRDDTGMVKCLDLKK